MIRSFANVAVSGKGIYRFGGLVGDNAGTGTITQSYATGSVFGGNANGGLVGLNLGEISRSLHNRQRDRERRGRRACGECDRYNAYILLGYSDLRSIAKRGRGVAHEYEGVSAIGV